MPRMFARTVAASVLLVVALVGCRPEAPVEVAEPVAAPVTAVEPESPTREAPAEESSESPTEVPLTEPAETEGIEEPPAEDPTPEAGTALAVLETLEVKGRAPKTGYDRDSFGWRDDMDRNGCDTRNDVLRRDLTGITIKPRTQGCVVLAGTLADRFSGDNLAFHQQDDNSVDVDHLVSLSDAHQSGAAGWDGETKRRFANDPLNLLAVDAGLNRQKGDSDAATWLPPNKGFRCEYVARQIAVKAEYGLWVKPAEKDAMVGVLAGCPDQGMGFQDQWPGTGEGDIADEAAPAPEETSEPAPAPAPAPAPPAGRAPGGDTYFKNCTAARDAGAAPVRAGDPGYGKHLDRDGDGVGCE